jgi:hypothetical protein
MSAGRALDDQRILTELIAEFIDMKSARHGANCCGISSARPSSIAPLPTLYEAFGCWLASNPKLTKTALPPRFAVREALAMKPRPCLESRVAPHSRSLKVRGAARGFAQDPVARWTTPR